MKVQRYKLTGLDTKRETEREVNGERAITEVWKGEGLHVEWLGRNMDIKAVACVTTGASNGPFAFTPTPFPWLGSTAAV